LSTSGTSSNVDAKEGGVQRLFLRGIAEELERRGGEAKAATDPEGTFMPSITGLRKRENFQGCRELKLSNSPLNADRPPTRPGSLLRRRTSDHLLKKRRNQLPKGDGRYLRGSSESAGALHRTVGLSAKRNPFQGSRQEGWRRTQRFAVREKKRIRSPLFL